MFLRSLLGMSNKGREKSSKSNEGEEYRRFTKRSSLTQAESIGVFTHRTQKMTKTIPHTLEKLPKAKLPQKYKALWYVKQVENALLARREVVAQELFRLLIPGHPKTRLLIDEANLAFVASKQIQGQALPSDYPPRKGSLRKVWKRDWNQAILDGRYTGLGQIMLVALFANEFDLKRGNFILDRFGQIIKFDGDYCFADLRNNISNNIITEHELASLPYPGGYQPINWLGVIAMGSPLFTPLWSEEISSHWRFRGEVNHALLKVLVLPDELIRIFIHAYVSVPYEEELIYNELIERRNHLFWAAIQNSDFCDYLKQAQANEALNEYLLYLKQFVTMGKNYLFAELENCEELIRANFIKLQQKAFLEAEAETQREQSEDQEAKEEVETIKSQDWEETPSAHKEKEYKGFWKPANSYTYHTIGQEYAELITANQEIAQQEFLRLFIPAYPKTFLTTDTKNGLQNVIAYQQVKSQPYIQRKTWQMFWSELEAGQNSSETQQILLKLLLLSEELITLFIEAYMIREEDLFVPLEADELSAEILAKIKEIRQRALSSQAFCDYLQSELAEAQCQRFSDYLLSFEIMSQNDKVNKVLQKINLKEYLHSLQMAACQRNALQVDALTKNT